MFLSNVIAFKWYLYKIMNRIGAVAHSLLIHMVKKGFFMSGSRNIAQRVKRTSIKFRMIWLRVKSYFIINFLDIDPATIPLHQTTFRRCR